MTNYKTDILNKICYTELVYGRINKKLGILLSTTEIEKMILETIKNTSENDFQKIGKNIYITNTTYNIRLTINSNSTRIITADRLEKIKRETIK